MKGHGSPFRKFPKISTKSSGASRSNDVAGPPLVGDDVCDRRLCKADGVGAGLGLSTGIGRERQAAVHSPPAPFFFNSLASREEEEKEQTQPKCCVRMCSAHS